MPGRIAAIWARLLGTAAVGADDNVFELGADSLAIVQMAAEMQRAGLSAAPGDIFAHPTPRALAAHLGGRDTVADPAGSPSGTGLRGDTDGPAAQGQTADTAGSFPDADLSSDDLAQVLNLFRAGEDTQ